MPSITQTSFYCEMIFKLSWLKWNNKYIWQKMNLRNMLIVDFISIIEYCWWWRCKYVMCVYFFPLFLNSGRLSGAVVEKARSFVFVI